MTSNNRMRIEAANAHMASDRMDEALALFEVVLKENPEAVAAYIGIGRIHLKSSDFKRAEQYFLGAVHVAKNPARPLVFLALAVEAQGEVDRALELSLQALENDPDLLRARLTLSRLYLQTNQYGEAEAQAREALRREPSSGPALALLSKTLKAQGKSTESLHDLISDVLNRPADSPKHCLHRGRLMLQLKEYSESDALLAQHLRASPDDSEALIARAQALTGMGDNRGAALLLERVLQLHPHLFTARMQLARAHLANRDYEPARSILTTLANGDKQSPEVHFMLADVFAARQLFRQSLEELEAGILNSEDRLQKNPMVIEIRRMTCSDEEKVVAYRTALSEEISAE